MKKIETKIGKKGTQKAVPFFTLANREWQEIFYF